MRRRRSGWRTGVWSRMASLPLRKKAGGFGGLGLDRALSDRLLPFLVAATAFLAALAFAASLAAATLARHWQEGAEAALTVQIPAAGEKEAQSVLAVLRADPVVATAHLLSPAELDELLRPWLGADPSALALPLPAVIAVKLGKPQAPLDALRARVRAVAPDALVESHGLWAGRIAILARSLEASAVIAIAVVAAVAIAVVAVTTHAGLLARRETIVIVHGLGATDGLIASRFARRASHLAAIGGGIGALAALPVLLALASLAQPLGWLAGAAPAIGGIPSTLWLVFPLLPIGAGAIGYGTAEVTARLWLRRLP